MTVIDLPAKVLITGASGFIGSHIVNQLFTAGYSILGTVRTAAKGDWIKRRYPGFQYEIVEDLTTPHAFEDVFEKYGDINYVIHTASPSGLVGSDSVSGLTAPTIEGAKQILLAAHNYGPSIKKFVYTSTLAAAYPMLEGVAKPDFTLTPDLWNPITMRDGLESQEAGSYVDETFAEKAVWEFSKDEDVQFAVTSVLVPLAYGPPIHEATYENIGGTAGLLKKLLELPKDTTEAPPVFVGYADVRDIARSHIQALFNRATDGKRLLPIAGLADSQRVLDILHDLRAEETEDVTVGTPGFFKRESYFKYDNSETQELLKLDYIPFAKSVLDEFDALMELKKQAK